MRGPEIPQEELASRLALTGIAIALAAACLYLIWAFWVISVSINISSRLTLILISFILTSFLSGRLYLIMRNYLSKAKDSVLDPSRMVERDRWRVNLAAYTGFGTVALLMYIYIEMNLLSSNPLPVYLTDSQLPSVVKVNAILVEFISIGTALLAIGSFWVVFALIKFRLRKAL